MSGGPPRKIPRIISRTKPKNRTQPTITPKEEEEKAPDSGQEALVKELSKEKVVVKDGCLVAVQHIEKGAVHGIVGATPTHGGRRVIIDIPMLDPETEPYIENPLPEMVFLTHYGLERHAKQKHKEHFDTIMEEIDKIQKEWERRERERVRLREKALITKARHESFALNAIRYAQNARLQGRSEAGSSVSAGAERFEACKICNLLINVKHPTAMDHHLRAHKKNDELKSQLTETYGEDMVNRLTCHECRLVFTDSNKLDVHMEQTHIRKRKFVCKYCGHLCMSMTDLNSHKAEIHAITTNNSVISRTNHVLALRKSQDQRFPRVNDSSTYFGKDANFPRVYRPGQEESVCSTQCAECGLRLVRPSLLVRHMLRVHNKATFTCDVTTRNLPNIRIEVINTKIYWWCCSQRYVDRHEFLFHRKQEHLEPFISSLPNKEMHEPETRSFPEDKAEGIPIQPGSSSYNADLVHAQDGTFQVVLPEGLGDSDGQIYVLIPEGEEGEENKEGYIENHEDIEGEIHEDIQEEPIHEEIVEEEIEDYHLTEEQYAELREQYGDELCDMIVYVGDNEINNEMQPVEEHPLEEEEEVIEQKIVDLPPHEKTSEELTCEEMFEP